MAKNTKYLDKLVPYYAIYDGDKYKDDIRVSHNGKTYTIRRGEEVMIPLKIALILKRQEEQDKATALLIKRHVEEEKNLK